MDFQPVIAYVENILRNEKGVPGCDLKIMREHETLLRYSSGVSDYMDNVPVKGDELYYMYSCAKAFHFLCHAYLWLAKPHWLRSRPIRDLTYKVLGL